MKSLYALSVVSFSRDIYYSFPLVIHSHEFWEIKQHIHHITLLQQCVDLDTIFSSCIFRCLYSFCWSPHCSISFLKLLTILNYRNFGVKSVIPLLIIQRISKFQILFWFIFPFMFDSNADILGYSIMQIFWATWLYTILWMIISKPITCILHTRHAHHFMASFLYIFIYKLFIWFQTHHVPPFLSHWSLHSSFWPNTSLWLWSCIKVINAHHPTDLPWHINTPYFQIQRLKKDQVGIINPLDVLTKPLGRVLHSRHIRRIMGNYHSFILLLFYYLFALYIYTFFVLLLKIKDGVIQRMSHTYNPYIHSLPVSSNGTNILIY